VRSGATLAYALALGWVLVGSALYAVQILSFIADLA
jgi:hypothetical protein